MKFSTKITYGLRAMIVLAINKEKVSIPRIAKEENISAKYLERIFAVLMKAKLVKSEKGVSGGYFLNKKASSITVYDIINALEGEVNPFYCLDKDGKIFCGPGCNCGVTQVLSKIQKSVGETLKSIKLSDLVN